MSALYGPQGEYVAALVERARNLTTQEAWRLFAVWHATASAKGSTAWVAACRAAWSAERLADLNAAWDAAVAEDAVWSPAAAEDAAVALVVRDRISTEHYDTLTLPWRTVIGRIHPDDAEVTL